MLVLLVPDLLAARRHHRHAAAARCASSRRRRMHLAMLLAAIFAADGRAALVRRRSQPALLDHRPAGGRQLHRPACHAAGAAHLGGRGAVAAAGAVLVGGARGQLARYALWRSAATSVVAVVGRGLLPGRDADSLLVAPTELTRETPYLADHIAATRRGVGHRQRRAPRPGRRRQPHPRPTSGPTRRPSTTCGSGTATRCCRRSGSCRRSAPTTTSVSIDDDRYWVDGNYRQVLLSPRELNSARCRPGPSSTST